MIDTRCVTRGKEKVNLFLPTHSLEQYLQTLRMDCQMSQVAYKSPLCLAFLAFVLENIVARFGVPERRHVCVGTETETNVDVQIGEAVKISLIAWAYRMIAFSEHDERGPSTRTLVAPQNEAKPTSCRSTCGTTMPIAHRLSTNRSKDSPPAADAKSGCPRRRVSSEVNSLGQRHCREAVQHDDGKQPW
ncbi:hypothetical protein MRB53_037200 [Persea americana]|nr:hypothetical protein MRB53_037200 [Persea americana]